MKILKYVTLSLFLFIANSCSDNPQKSLNQIKMKLSDQKHFSYFQKAYYPNPMGTYDTLNASLVFSNADSSAIGYDFLIKSERGDEIYANGEYRIVNHAQKEVIFYPSEKQEEIKRRLNDNSYINYSPIALLNQSDWKFDKDTLIGGESYGDFFRVESDTIVNGNTIYTELHIFINRKAKQLERFERRNFFKGDLNQTIVYEYSDFNAEKSSVSLTYDYPEGYKSVAYGSEYEEKMLALGQVAPNFIADDLQNNTVDLEEFKGKKVLLNFSVINCGYCLQALHHFNQKDYQLPDNVLALYINPLDSRNKVIDYVEKFLVPFPVIAGAKKIAEMYGVSAYPTFILINEEGLIEKTILGYDKVFLDQLNNGQL
ncbi:peroxiredoxin family protein [Cyclobacterium amurskyense]|uniref:Putative thiol-disulfide oxidoreductase ResA n=1 Tax=Cyclobacterium amurskyense TaxID=320787 RepID=A0A0H4PNV6_9BACT|nr:TlpA disulfide reductase family protein [Cyclobacterium amurskyense]AKP49922.1 Putative thiol-disulfide oxidoreductase ResA [Cyclobacterium amurskyense]